MKITRRSALKSSALAVSALALRGTRVFSQASPSVDAHIDILPGEPIATISPEIYGHFIEHLGGVVYDGVWVGPDSKIANTGGVRQSFIDAMRSVGATLLRWPGGCFADSYDWHDGIGSPASRPARTSFWTQQESNRYGLHEFMHTCRAIGAKPYLAADMRSLPARDFYQELEYCNAPAGAVPSNSAAPAVPNSLAAQRAANGDRDPFNVDLWGVGNESWGCGGNLEPEEYAAMFRRFTAWAPNYGGIEPRFVAVGGNGDDVDFTRRMFKALYANTEKRHLFGLSIHYYTSGSPTEFAGGDALKFTDAEHYDMLARGSMMDGIIRDQWTAIQTTQQPGQPAVRLIVDEWGGWYGNGTRLGPTYNLSQQSTMRDALLTGITLDIFQRHAEKVAAACVAQSINCLHSLVLAMGDQVCVTPAYHVFKMYLPHHGAQAVRAEFSAPGIANPLAKPALQMDGVNYAGPASGSRTLAGLSGSASISATNPKQLTLTVVNPHLDKPITTEIAVGGASIASASGTVLAAPDIHAHNDFAHPDAVKPVQAAVGPSSGGRLTHTFPPASVTSLQITFA
jgi:alpha-L-arabinofuranosidase